MIDEEQFKKAIATLQKFKEAQESVISELDQSVKDIQRLEEELAGEEKEINSMLTDVGNVIDEEGFEAGGEIAQLVQEQDSVENAIEKVNNDLESEIDRLQDLATKVMNLRSKGDQAEEAIEIIERYERQNS